MGEGGRQVGDEFDSVDDRCVVEGDSIQGVKANRTKQRGHRCAHLSEVGCSTNSSKHPAYITYSCVPCRTFSHWPSPSTWIGCTYKRKNINLSIVLKFKTYNIQTYCITMLRKKCKGLFSIVTFRIACCKYNKRIKESQEAWFVLFSYYFINITLNNGNSVVGNTTSQCFVLGSGLLSLNTHYMSPTWRIQRSLLLHNNFSPSLFSPNHTASPHAHFYLPSPRISCGWALTSQVIY